MVAVWKIPPFDAPAYRTPLADANARLDHCFTPNAVCTVHVDPQSALICTYPPFCPATRYLPVPSLEIVFQHVLDVVTFAQVVP